MLYVMCIFNINFIILLYAFVGTLININQNERYEHKNMYYVC